MYKKKKNDDSILEKKFLKLAVKEKEKSLDSRKNREIGFTEETEKKIIELRENSWFTNREIDCKKKKEDVK